MQCEASLQSQDAGLEARISASAKPRRSARSPHLSITAKPRREARSSLLSKAQSPCLSRELKAHVSNAKLNTEFEASISTPSRRPNAKLKTRV